MIIFHELCLPNKYLMMSGTCHAQSNVIICLLRIAIVFMTKINVLRDCWRNVYSIGFVSERSYKFGKLSINIMAIFDISVLAWNICI